MKKMTIMTLLLAFLFSCTESPPIAPHIVIILQAETDTPIKIAAEDLKVDINKVLSAQVTLVESNQALPQADYYFLLGKLPKLSQSTLLNESLQNSLTEKNPGPRGGLIHQSQLNDKPLILLTGEDIQGTQYAIYDYSKNVLGIDPLTYWTDKQPSPKSAKDIVTFNNTIIPSPVVPLLVYFENDVDELLNLKSPSLEYDWHSFTNMIDSLVRLKYNGIEMFDMLGRIEFYTRPAYLEQHPNYQLNVPYLEKMMQYVHDKGMYIQVDMMQGRQLHTLSVEASTCWADNKQEWIDGWRYYLTETPVKNIDIFALRPRNQLLDWKYKSTCGENKVDVFNEVYVEFNKIVNEFKPDAPRVCICYSDGMEMFNDGFNPPKDFIIAWSDHGFGRFDHYPEDTRGYKFGTYMHAGYWKNHDVMDTYPELVDEIMTMMFDKYDATHYMEVNGQTFRPFLLNIEAYAQAAVLGSEFDGQAFYLQWATRYFGEKAAPDIVNALKQLHEANERRIGYVEILWQVKNMQAYLANEPVRQPGKEEFTVTLDQVTKFFTDTQPRIDNLVTGLTYVENAAKNIPESNTFFHDHIVLPMNIYLDLLQYNQTLIDLITLKNQEIDLDKSIYSKELTRLLTLGKTQLDTIYQRRMSGDKNPKWATWYEPAKRRPNNGFPTVQDFEKVIKTLNLEQTK
jgi:hypothetical protein